MLTSNKAREKGRKLSAKKPVRFLEGLSLACHLQCSVWLLLLVSVGIGGGKVEKKTSSVSVHCKLQQQQQRRLKTSWKKPRSALIYGWLFCSRNET